MAYNTETFLAIAMQHDGIVRLAAPRSLLAAGMAYHFAREEGDAEARKVLDVFGATLKRQGAGKGEVSTKRKHAKQAGEHVAERFAAELATGYESEVDLIEACMCAAIAQGARSVAKLLDLLIHGDAMKTENDKDAAKREREAKKEAELADDIQAVELTDAPAPFLGEPVMPKAPAKPAKRDNVDDAAGIDLAESVAALVERFGFDAVSDILQGMAEEATADVA